MRRMSKRRTSSQTSALMAPVRVLAPNPEASKRMFEPDEPAPVRVTRQKKAAAVTNHEETNTGESMLHQDMDSSLNKDDGSPSVDEDSTVHMQLTPAASTVMRNRPLDSAAISEQPELPTPAEGKFLI